MGLSVVKLVQIVFVCTTKAKRKLARGSLQASTKVKHALKHGHGMFGPIDNKTQMAGVFQLPFPVASTGEKYQAEVSS